MRLASGRPTPPRPTHWARFSPLRMLRYALVPSLCILSLWLYARGMDLARAAGCTLGESCTSSAGLEASMYVAGAVFMWLGLALSLMLYLAFKAWKWVFRRARNTAQGESR